MTDAFSMNLSRIAINSLLIATFVLSLAGQGLIVLCTSEDGHHVAHELSTRSTCDAQSEDAVCLEDELHIDDPANHPGETGSVTRTLVGLAAFDTKRGGVKLEHTRAERDRAPALLSNRPCPCDEARTLFSGSAAAPPSRSLTSHRSTVLLS